MLYWTWNGKIILPFFEEKDNNSNNNNNNYNNSNIKCKTQLSLKFLFAHGSNINTIFNVGFAKNETLFNMIGQNDSMTDSQQLKMLIEYKFDFKKLINVYDSIKHETGLLILCKYSHSYANVKLFIQHCAGLGGIGINIMQCDITGRNALHRSAIADINTFIFLLNTLYFSNTNDKNDTINGINALQKQDSSGNTIAHTVATNSSPNCVNVFKLLQKYNFNFNIYNHYGRLPIHCACFSNCTELLSFIIKEKIYNEDINCQTQNARNTPENGNTPLYVGTVLMLWNYYANKQMY